MRSPPAGNWAEVGRGNAHRVVGLVAAAVLSAEAQELALLLEVGPARRAKGRRISNRLPGLAYYSLRISGKLSGLLRLA